MHMAPFLLYIQYGRPWAVSKPTNPDPSPAVDHVADTDVERGNDITNLHVMVGPVVFSLIAGSRVETATKIPHIDTSAVDMSLTKYTPGLPAEGFCCWSLSGVEASVRSSMLHFQKTSTTSRRSWNQWAGAGWTLPSLDVGKGLTLVYRLRWNSLIGAGELRMNIPSLATISNDEKLVLRFRNGVVDWAICDLRTGRFEHQSQSNISADREWYDILINISPDSLRIYENGRNILARARSGTVSGSFDIVCELDELEAFEADLMDFRICPVAVGQDRSALLSTAAELRFDTASRDLNAQYFSVRQFDSPIKVAYTDSSLRFSTPSLTEYVPPPHAVPESSKRY